MNGDNAKQALSQSSLDTELGRMVIDQNLATTEEVQECLELQKAGSDPLQRTLSELLVAKGYVTARQIDRIKTTIEPTRSSQIPGYQIIRKIGAGAMARVYLARQLSLNREVAVKVLPKRLSENPDYVERFYKEGRAAGALNHPNIVQAIDVGEAGGFHYFVMEYVKGHSVYDELAEGKVYSEAEALDIVIQVAKALRHAHERGLIHRDVKPKNIMITPERVAKLADMGLAREASDSEAAQAERGRAFGTPYYISPEQVRGELVIDFRADIYSLGATFYHMVTARVPFDAATPAAVMHKHLRESLVPPDHINTTLSSGVGEVIEVMMAKRPEHRYSSTADLLVDLEAVRRGEPPLLARKRIDADVLEELADKGQEVEGADEYEPPPTPVQNVWLVILGATLVLSLLFNLIQLLAR